MLFLHKPGIKCSDGISEALTYFSPRAVLPQLLPKVPDCQTLLLFYYLTVIVTKIWVAFFLEGYIISQSVLCYSVHNLITILIHIAHTGIISWDRLAVYYKATECQGEGGIFFSQGTFSQLILPAVFEMIWDNSTSFSKILKSTDMGCQREYHIAAGIFVYKSSTDCLNWQSMISVPIAVNDFFLKDYIFYGLHD